MKGMMIKIKDGKIDVWREWCNEIKTIRKEEAIETLKDENCIQELFLIFKIGTDWYTIGLGEGECRPSDKSQEINLIHSKKKKECFDYSQRDFSLEFLYHIKQ